MPSNLLFRLCLIVSTAFLFSCTNRDQQRPLTTNDSTTSSHPDWILQGNIYEVNLRQYSPEGNFAGFEKHLDRLKDMGVQTFWFMPVHPISKKDRKGVMGSYYAVADYKGINPEYGTIEDWKKLVSTIHGKGMKVIIDWVPNHTGGDHPWLTNHPDFYVKDSAGNPVSPFDWTDVRKLNYDNKAMQDSMIESMKFWVTDTDIDGFRCDVAGEVPDSFWTRCIAKLKKIKPSLFMLAETDKPSVHRAGFNASYPWYMFTMMKKVANGERKASAIDSVINNVDTTYTKDAIRMFFTSNHDENSWNRADFGTMPGAVHAPFAVLTQTLGRSVPLIYSGQEEPVTDTISFFYKDTINFSGYKRAAFYKTLLNLRKENPALSATAAFSKVKAGNEDAVFSFTRQSGNNKILVITNLSAREQNIVVSDTALHGKPYNVFMGTNEELTAKEWKIEPWGYVIYKY